MKTSIIQLVLAIFMVLIFTTNCISGEKATRNECLVKVDEAIQLIKDKGVEVALKEIADKNGPYVWKDTHVYCIDTDNGSIIAHPRHTAMGFSLRYYKDVFGDNPYDLILDAINIRNQGWITYVTDRMGRIKPAKLKNMHYKKMPGENIIVLSGYYPEF